MHIKYCNTLFLLLFSSVISAQTSNSGFPLKTGHKGLTVGDKVPEIFIPKIINDEKQSAKITDYKDRLLILDFWATGCSGCVTALPRFENLQKQIGNAVKILPVTYESTSMVSNFLKKNKYINGMIIPTVVEDKILSNWFTFQSISHEVWIYKGHVVAITEPGYVTESNIRFILDGHKNDWLVKDDFIPNIKFDKPLLKIDETQYIDKQAPYYYAAIFEYRENAGFGKTTGTTRDSIRHTRRDYVINNLIQSIYYDNFKIAIGKTGEPKLPAFDPAHTILEVADRAKFEAYKDTFKIGGIWHRKHLVCFETVSPDTGQTEEKQALKLIKDLDYLLHIHCRYETRKVKCLVLVRTSDEDKIKSKTAQANQIIDLDGPVKKIHATHLSTLITLITGQPALQLIFDETNYKDFIDLDLEVGSLNDIPALRTALQAYGLDIKEEEREQIMYIISDNN